MNTKNICIRFTKRIWLSQTIDINNRDYYFSDINKNEIIRKRLIELKILGLKELWIEQFWITWKLSWIYIEKVWHSNDPQWKDLIDWIKSILNK